MSYRSVRIQSHRDDAPVVSRQGLQSRTAAVLASSCPARDEETCIASTVEHLDLELRLHNGPHEIVVVDGSTDRTWEILQETRTVSPGGFEKIQRSHGVDIEVIVGAQRPPGRGSAGPEYERSAGSQLGYEVRDPGSVTDVNLITFQPVELSQAKIEQRVKGLREAREKLSQGTDRPF